MSAEAARVPVQLGMFPVEEEPEPEADAGADIAYTKVATAAAVVRYLAARFSFEGAVWEPCAGGGAWLDPLSELGPVVATEIDPKAASVVKGRAVCWDALQGPPPDSPDIGALITNPPFSKITQFLKVGMAIPTCHLIALLVRQGWILPVGKKLERRVEIVWGPVAKPVEQVLMYPRLPFEGPKRNGKETDAEEYGVLIWVRQSDGGWLPSGNMVVRRLNWLTGEVS